MQKDDTSPLAEQEIINIPIGFPLIDFPDSNTFTKERWELGKRLFYDTQLSKNNTISCASCHHQKFAFGDSVAFSLGDNNSPGTSNAPTLANVAYHPYFTRAGGVSTLEMQILVPIQEHNEFNTNMLDVVDKLKLNNSYNQQAQIAYGRTMDPYVITRAIATFERSLISGNSRYDEFNYAGKSDALNTSEQRGLQLFRSNKTNCSQCHSGFNFTNYAFENNGLYLNYADSGRMRLTHLPEDRAKFKVPTLRNIALTGPYMHDGSLATLEDVVEHYNSGGKNHINKSNLITALSLTNQEKQDLVNF
ncbi:MAG: cytochrome-c peroxidase [Bacteroidetes bacterium]|nr:cytochrome-c peroxidase [Bacteroidota bacterium]